MHLSRWPMFLVLVTLALLAISIVVAVSSGRLELSPASACNATCYR